jgi:hypothetical protein
MAAPTVNVKGLTPGQTYVTSANNAYTADISGNVANVPAGRDVADLEAWGAEKNNSALSVAATGIYPLPLPLLHARNSDGSVLAAAASSGKFGVSITLGTSTFLVTEAANSSTKTDTAVFDVILPSSYIAGQNVTITANVQYVVGSGTIGSHTVTFHAYRTAKDGTQGSDLVATGAVSVPATATDVTSVITGATLLPGDRLTLSAVMVIQDTGASNITGQLNSVRLS